MSSYDVENVFTNHPPSSDQAECYERIRGKAKEMARVVEGLCPGSRERSLALTNLEQCVFWANAAIARHPLGETAPAKVRFDPGDKVRLNSGGPVMEVMSLAQCEVNCRWEGDDGAVQHAEIPHSNLHLV